MIEMPIQKGKVMLHIRTNNASQKDTDNHVGPVGTIFLKQITPPLLGERTQFGIEFRVNYKDLTPCLMK